MIHPLHLSSFIVLSLIYLFPLIRLYIFNLAANISPFPIEKKCYFDSASVCIVSSDSSLLSPSMLTLNSVGCSLDSCGMVAGLLLFSMVLPCSNLILPYRTLPSLNRGIIRNEAKGREGKRKENKKD